MCIFLCNLFKVFPWIHFGVGSCQTTQTWVWLLTFFTQIIQIQPNFRVVSLFGSYYSLVFVLCQCGGDIPLVPSVWLRILVATNKKKIFFEQKARVGNIIFTRWGNCAFFTWFWISEGMREGDFVKVDHTARDRKFVAEWWVFFYPLCHFI